MTFLVWAATLVVAAYSAFQFGRRWEMGKQEEERDRIEDVSYARGQRPGTVTLSTVKIRR